MKIKKPTVAIDVSPIVYGTGVAVYTKELVNHLVKDTSCRYKLFGYSFRRKSELKIFFQIFNTMEHVQTFILPFPPTVIDFLWNRMHIIDPKHFIGEYDLLHSSDWAEPPSSKIKVTTIHDITPLLLPDQTHSKIVSVHTKKLAWVKKESKSIIVPSQATKADLLEYGFQNITVIPEAVSSKITKIDDGERQKILKKYDVTSNYMIMIGTAKRKNIEMGIRALKKKVKGINKLVVVGENKNYIASNDVVFTGFITDLELSALLESSELLLYLSHYEGFGLPILEAFRLKTPVVCSDIPVFREVGSNACIFVDQNSLDSVTSGISKARAKRKEFVHKGSIREKEYSWSENASQTVKLYKSLL